jgi:type VI secretion system secreted protein VgrG
MNTVFNEMALFSSENRPLRLKLPYLEEGFREKLYLQEAEGWEGINAGLDYRLCCVSQKAGQSLKRFIGQPAEIQYTTDSGEAHRICGVITEAKEGAGDGGLAFYRLRLQDISALLHKRIGSRVFRELNEIQITEKIIEHWRQAHSRVAFCFDLDCTGLHGNYPPREFTFQHNETVMDFLRRLWGRRGISWVIRAGKRPAAGAAGASGDKRDDTAVHTLALFDDSFRLPMSAAGKIRFHRAGATEEEDAITVWTPTRELQASRVTRHSYDYKTVRISEEQPGGAREQGDWGDPLGRAVEDFLLDTPHAGDDGEDYRRLSVNRAALHTLAAKHFEGESSVRSLSAGTWFDLTGHYEIDQHPKEERQFVVTEVHTRARNNLPRELEPRVAELFAEQAKRFFSVPLGEDQRHMNRFSCVRRRIPIVPDFDPRRDLPRMPPMTARVVGPEGQEVWCDEQGRIKVRILGLRPEDHEHAGGAGTNENDSDSAWVRFVTPWAHEDYGSIHVPRVGSEVFLEWLHGDPDKPVVVGSLYNGARTPPTFSHQGELPGNRFITGIKTKEISGRRYNQLRLDDTPGEISAQLASEHAHSEVNLGWLTHPRHDGEAETRGEGLEIRTDAALAARAQQGMVLSTDPRPKAAGNHLDRNELMGLARVLQGIQTTLEDLAKQHRQAGEGDIKSLDEALEKLEAWKQDGGAPIIALSAQSSLVAASQDNLALGAQTQVDIISGANTQLSVGKRLLLRAQQGLTAFAHTLGMKLIAASGKLQIEAHQDEIEVTSAKKIILSARDEIILNAPIIRHTAQGAQITLGNSSIVSQTEGIMLDKAAQHVISGPQGATPKGVNLPKSELQTDELFVLRNRNSGGPMPDKRYRIVLDSGRVIEGVSDSDGKTSLLEEAAIHIAQLTLLDD